MRLERPAAPSMRSRWWCFRGVVPVQILPGGFLYSFQPVLPLLFSGPAFDTSSAAAAPTPPPSFPLSVWNSPRWHLCSCDSLQMLCIPGCSAGFWVSPVARSTRQVEREEKKRPCSCQNIARMREKIVRETENVLCGQDPSQPRAGVGLLVIWAGLGDVVEAEWWGGGMWRGLSKPQWGPFVYPEAPQAIWRPSPSVKEGPGLKSRWKAGMCVSSRNVCFKCLPLIH